MLAKSNSFADILQTKLDSLVETGLFRKPKTLDAAQGARVRINGRDLINFCSNDYLGLANDRRLIDALKNASEIYGIGSGASPLVCGRSQAHEELEQTVASFTGRDRAICFSSGYLANLSLATAFCSGRDDLIVQDKLCHASIIDGGLLSRAQFKRYPHANVDSLEAILQASKSSLKLVLTDSVFSMSGDIAPCKELASVCASYNAFLAVDDAHGFGLLGKGGRGALNEAGLSQEDVPLMLATFGKAMGVSGAFIAGPECLIETLKQKARPYMYSTAMPPALASTILESLHLVRNESWRRDHLFSLITRFRRGAKAHGVALMPSRTPIQALLLGETAKAMSLSDALYKKGFLVVAIRPPTVPVNSSRLRITLSAAHSEQDVDNLLQALSEAL